MAYKTFMPIRKADQVAWAARFVAAVTNNVAEYGLTPTLFTSFTAINTPLQAAWIASQSESTRTKVTVDQRNNLLKDMKALAGKLVSIIQGTPSVTSDMLIAAGLTVRSDARTKPDMPLKPFLRAMSVDGRNVTIEIMQTAAKRGKPARVAMATILTAMGTSCPMSMDGFIYTTATGKTTVTLPFPSSTTGDTVWITAFWSNTAKVSGPAATPISVNLAAGGNLQTSDAEEPMTMKVAA